MDAYDFTVSSVKEAGGILMNARDEGFATMAKDDDPRDIVTTADKKVNDFLLQKIRQAFPEHSIYSEEGGDVAITNEHSDSYQWVIDPIDGSANFSRGIPHFAICIGLLESGVPVVGAVYNPVTDELFSFKKGNGAFLNGAPMHVSDITELSKSHVFFHAGRKEELRDWGGESYRRLLGSVRKTSNFAASSLDACFVAAGRIEANVYGTLSTLDIAPALGLLVEVGGVIADAQGNTPIFSRVPQKIYMANNQTTLDAVRSLLER